METESNIIDEPQKKADDDHIRILSVFHYVVAGFAIAGLLFLGLHFAIMNTVFTNEFMNEEEVVEIESFFGIFRWFYLLMGFVFLADAAVNVLSAIYMKQRRHRTFSLVVAGINCLWMPLGTVLGVFTILVLLRPSVLKTYEK